MFAAAMVVYILAILYAYRINGITEILLASLVTYQLRINSETDEALKKWLRSASCNALLMCLQVGECDALSYGCEVQSMSCSSGPGKLKIGHALRRSSAASLLCISALSLAFSNSRIRFRTRAVIMGLREIHCGR